MALISTGTGTANPLSWVRFPSAPPSPRGVNCNRQANGSNSTVCTIPPLEYTRTLDPHNGFISLSFTQGPATHVILTGLTSDELTPSREQELVTRKISELERPAARSLWELVNTYKYDSDFGGNDATRKKNSNHFVDLLTRDGIDLDGTDTRHLNIIIGGKSLPEQWERYNLPHKLRQLTSIFSKKNLKIWN